MIDKSKYGFIYKTTFLKTNMFYVGKRVIQNNCRDKEYLGSCTIIMNLVKKYGSDNFKREILEHCKSEEELLISEKYWVKLLKATSREIGYNIQEGGKCSPNIKNHPDKEEILKRRSKTFKDNYSNNIEAQIKRKNQLREAKKNVDYSKTGLKKRKKIVSLDLETNKVIEIYQSIKIAEKEIGKGGVCSSIKNKNLCNGKYLQYLNESGEYPKYIKKEVWNKGISVNFSPKTQFKKGNIPHNKGIPISNKVRDKISKKLKGNTPWNKGKDYLAIRGVNHFASKSILRFNIEMKLIKEYVSFTQAVEEGFIRSGLRKACGKYLGIYRDNYWCLKDDYEKRENK